ncbi:hypothetical protein CMQ_3846 [Grosmannia clavigera kw1407]|uniref:Fe2OG dioxygenase domain-containing protein n=1 Tax=Grosmannia clavigera (strain kw1407 / UAMH 11150) TaxID=655863 RepID=F0X9X4_GROCL|nr:uncharacterized protein CMQ_3846 [Grosmannia clavigera kw1407]EFX05777.1 hypothetical protein CMQ_3846 [Grosmannia clavigera kw1407]
MQAFNPKVHLAFEPPKARHSFTELGLDRPKNTPDMCFTEPFPLFSPEGVRMIRRELLSKKVLDKHLTSWPRAPCIISGHEETATWIREMWCHPAVRESVETAFGLPLQILGRRGEIGHCNVQLGAGGVEAVYQLGEEAALDETDGTSVSTKEKAEQADSQGVESAYDDVLTDAWHRDSTQVVVVVMLSDATTMEGGETAIRDGSGHVLKARGAQAGSAVLMQGAHTWHAALRATGGAHERISMVTSWHFRDADLDDSGTSLRSIRSDEPMAACIQDHFFAHKLRKLRDRIDVQLDRLEARRVVPAEDPDRPLLGRAVVEEWVGNQLGLLTQTAWELCERCPRWLYQDVPPAVMADYGCRLVVDSTKDATSSRLPIVSRVFSPDWDIGFLAGLFAGISVALLSARSVR